MLLLPFSGYAYRVFISVNSIGVRGAIAQVRWLRGLGDRHRSPRRLRCTSSRPRGITADIRSLMTRMVSHRSILQATAARDVNLKRGLRSWSLPASRQLRASVREKDRNSMIRCRDEQYPNSPPKMALVSCAHLPKFCLHLSIRTPSSYITFQPCLHNFTTLPPPP